MTEPMTDAEVKRAIERHKLSCEISPDESTWWIKCVSLKIRRHGPTLTEAVAEVVRQIEEKQE